MVSKQYITFLLKESWMIQTFFGSKTLRLKRLENRILIPCDFTSNKVLLAAVLLVVHMDTFEFADQYDVVDFFAGEARLARAGRFVGASCIALDIGFHENPRVFDINSDSGFMSLVFKGSGIFMIHVVCISQIHVCYLHHLFKKCNKTCLPFEVMRLINFAGEVQQGVHEFRCLLFIMDSYLPWLYRSQLGVSYGSPWLRQSSGRQPNGFKDGLVVLIQWFLNAKVPWKEYSPTMSINTTCAGFTLWNAYHHFGKLWPWRTHMINLMLS